MKTFDITIPVTEASFEELSPEQQTLVTLARKATFRSYAPYSKFSVGAAILLDNGEMLSGSNQENAAYPSGTCAERTTAFYAHSTYPDAKFKTIAIAARGTDGKELDSPISPCGACRQCCLNMRLSPELTCPSYLQARGAASPSLGQVAPALLLF